ncbi:hypothetical protein PR003_g11272 [Phytophthora rubi]|uniref:Uncharacterized protein n=1 Tax=Phytophthora rubi TaxID=129364 RepID=A0A6A3LSG9_9STRA|nr:hypothetical protein PR002_g11956 [Phytophthora rubi]KAE9028946.1 hypothetical protein PR001_g11624 [Phytophthora rubi]KAE9338920.1 hypothetical protein PR003_g11272 [Phytophthora rubi]
MQTAVEGLSVIAHLAVLRGFYSWEFGSYGLSFMHFARRHQRDRREAERKYDFGDFTAKNKLPAAAEPLDITDLVAALEMLAQIVRKVYKALVCEIVEAATSPLAV